MGVRYNTSIVRDGLVLHLDAANTKSYPSSGTTWYDLSGRGNNGTLTNGPTYSSANGGSIVFDGIDDYTSTNLDISWNNTNSVSISFFIKPPNVTQYTPFLGKTSWEWQLMQKQTSLQFVYWDTGGGHTNGTIPELTDFFIANAYVAVDMVWNYSTNNLYFYKNGSFVSSYTWDNASINQNIAEGIKLGGNIYRWGTNGNYWAGTISNLKIYSRSLSSTEISQNYEALRGRYGL